MRILIVTNIYPPQELGGYGRSMADFAYGLLQKGHHVCVLTSDAPYLQTGHSSDVSKVFPSERIDRRLLLKGSYQDCVSLITDPAQCIGIDRFNSAVLQDVLKASWDGILVGNIDLLGPELLQMLLEAHVPVLHHIGFMDPPFPAQFWPQSSHYTIVAASKAVRTNLLQHGLQVAQSPVVYPGVRTDLFGNSLLPLSPALRLARSLYFSGQALGSVSNPLKIGFAGLLMGTKGVHTLVEALVLLYKQGIQIQASLAGAEYQQDYQRQLECYLEQSGMRGLVQFVGQLNRAELRRFWDLQNLGVFSSIYPEAFGIVSAEVMASGVGLVTSAVGGSAELLPYDGCGFRYEPGNASDLAGVLRSIVSNPRVLFECAEEGQKLVRNRFDVMASAQQLENLFLERAPLQ